MADTTSHEDGIKDSPLCNALLGHFLEYYPNNNHPQDEKGNKKEQGVDNTEITKEGID